MTHHELKRELYRVRDNRFAIRSKCSDLYSVRRQELEKIGNGAIDYSRERLQATKDPDRAIISALEYADRRENELKQAIEELEEANRYYEDLIYSIAGLNGEILRLFFIEGYSMKRLADRISYEKNYTYRLWNGAIQELLEVINHEQEI